MGCGRWIQTCVSENSVISENDQRVRDFFEEYDTNRNGVIELSEFLHFYTTKSVTSIVAVK